LPLSPDVRQVVVITTAGWEAQGGELRRFVRDAGGPWRPVREPCPVTIGRAGCGWGLGEHPPQAQPPTKREGDGRSPAGVFRIGPAFGRAERIDTGLVYLPLDRGHWCIDVPDSPHYNEIVHEDAVGEQAIAGSTEPMRRDIHLSDDQYRIGFAIGHNPAREPAAGSCIFAHLWETDHTPTSGCVGMAEDDLRDLLAWLDEAAAARLVLLPEPEYRRLRDRWQLPDWPELAE
ncbi:MAG: hypothetical protein RLZZ440_1933, partial [Planctomycetota bacterium]